MSEFYILDDNHNPVQTDLMTWARWYEQDEHRIVRQTSINADIRVSTVFLGLNMSLHQSIMPLVFETMVFGGEMDDYQERHASWGAALECHERICAEVRQQEITS